MLTSNESKPTESTPPQALRTPSRRTFSSRWLWRTVKVVGAAVIIAVAIYWLKFAPIRVDDHVVQRGDIVVEVMGTGTLEARKTATISPKISGRIVQVVVDQGDQVTTGQVLVTLDDRDLQQQVAIAEATVTVARATVDRAVADSARAAAVLEQARRDHQRQQGLWQRDIASSTAFDKAVEVRSVAEAGVTHAAAAVSEARKQLLAAEKTLDFHRARLDDTVIKASFDGLIVRRHRDPGDVVAPGGAVLSLIAPQEMWISAWVDETQMAQLEPEQPARVLFRSEPSSIFSGKVVRLGRETDRETREFVVDVRVEKLPANWAVGQRAEVLYPDGSQATGDRPPVLTCDLA